jgi:hypothetical protein
MLSSESESVDKEAVYVLNRDGAMSRQKTRIGAEVREIAGCRHKGGEGESRERDVTLRTRS